MTYDPDIHHRRSIRLQGFDYASANAYFVTMCVEDRECLFGDIVDGDMRVNDAGRVVDKWWTKLPEKFAGVSLDEVVIMPNHFHGIVVLGAVGADPCVCPVSTDPCVCPVFPGSRSPASSDQIINKGAHAGAPLQRIVQWFKTMTTNEYIRCAKKHGWPSFPGRLWQRNYYERIIRNENELAAIREYIRCNPMQWEQDEENPANWT